MIDEAHARVDQHAAEDDFEWVNAWAEASARQGKRLSPQAAASFAKAAPKTPDLNPPDLKTPDLKTPDLNAPDLKAPDLKAPDLASVSLIEAPPLAESSPVSDRNAPEPEAAALHPRSTGQDAPASPVAGIVHEPPVESEPEGLPEPDAAAATANADGDDPIPQSTAEVAPLPEGPPHLQSLGRRPWTSLFRLITGGASQSPRDQAAEPSISMDDTVSADAPAPAASESELPAQPGDTDIPLAPDQLERDIAEIELVRDQLLSEPSSSHKAVEGGVLGTRTSDIVPILVGGALGFILLVVFGAAASFVSLR